MTATVIKPVSTAVHVRAIRLLLLAAALTAFTLGLNLLLPESAPLLQIAIWVVIHTAILSGLWLGLSRTALTARARVTTWLAFAVPLTAWRAVIWCLAVNDAFVARPNAGGSWLPVAIFLPILLGLPVLLRSRRVGAVLDAMPLSWLVGLQLYRVRGGIFLLGWATGNLAGTFALPAGTGDLVVGLLALPVAVYVQSGGRGGRAAAVAWNWLGILDLATAVTIGMLSTPSPLQLIVLDRPNLIGVYPTVMIPAFAVPSSILFHALSLRQLHRLAAQQRRRLTPAADAGE